MRTSLDVLRRFVDLPADPAAARVLLDEVGLEVKRIDPDRPGVPVTLELLANRGDHHGHVGLAREVAGRTGGDVREPRCLDLVVGEGTHPVQVQTPLCPVYALTELRRTAEVGLDAEARALLEACGLKPVHPVVDATNVANLELGQPTHAFDADTLVGPVTVRLSRAGERAWPLFAPEPVDVPEGTVVIADDEKILALAGVIGCEESKTTAATTRILLEAAAFDPVAVRKASRALDVHTDSSARFERGADFTLPLRGAGRVAALLSAGWAVHGTTSLHASWADPARLVPFEPAACRAFLAVDEDDASLWARLGRYGFVREGAGVRVPAHRLWDVEHPADLYEEIAKSIGYDATPTTLPAIDMGAVPSHAEQVWDTAAEVLVGAGFYEVVTDGFHGRQLVEQLGFGEGHPLHAHVETANALDRAYSLLKNETLGQALEGVALNVRMKHDEIKAFERTRTFHPDPGAPNGVCTERTVLWAIAAGHERPRTWAGAAREIDAHLLAGLVDELALALRVPFAVSTAPGTHPLQSALHPGRQALVRQGDRVVGIVGEVHPAVVARFRLKRVRPVYLEIDGDALLAEPVRAVFAEPPRVPPVERDLAFTLPRGVEAAALCAALEAGAPDWLRRVAVTDLYAHVQDGAPVRTLTVTLTWANDEGDRTAEALNAATEQAAQAALAALGPRGVTLRA
ncbi:MAG: phenylalanine--tRNA ligase subunit beta [Alphaproteobacteria bacterium]|nr:phenylalanine--tRNA ligase subunit beta [Alphaproteobacteria bacterium]